MTTQDAQLLLRRYLAGECTAEEKELLEGWWEEEWAEYAWGIPAGQEGVVHDRMLSRIKMELGGELEGVFGRESDGTLKRGSDETLARGLDEAGEEADRRAMPVRRLEWRRYAGIAAAVLVMAASGWFWWSQHQAPSVDDSPITIEANPGGDRAMLTLGNGKKVMLDSAGNGMLVLQGNDRVMKQNGELDYKQNAGAKEVGESAAVFNTLTTPKGGQYKLVLPDGTQVWLDAASSITYPVAFSGKKRQVSISGQAYFEVIHDAMHPFEVDVRGQTVSDIGTAFNINAYSDEPAIKITLVNGAAAVGRPGIDAAAAGRGGHEIVLKQPGQQAEYRDGQLQLAPDADLKAVLAWKNGLFYLTSADVATVMRQISRWYDIEVVFEKGIPGGHITGEVPRNTMLSTTLQVLRTSGVHFRTEDKTIYVTP